jgi:hypothetical protein
MKIESPKVESSSIDGHFRIEENSAVKNESLFYLPEFFF